MSYTKRQFITAALEEIGLASYVFELQPEQLESALMRLDSMMANWNGKGIRLSYPLPANPEDSSLDEATTVPDSANDAIIKNLAIMLAPAYGKTVQQETKVAAKDGYNTLLARATFPREQRLPRYMPLGAGNKYWANYGTAFVNRPAENVQVGGDGELELY